MLILVRLSFATISPYFLRNSTNSFFFLANLLKNPVSSAADIGFLFRGSTNLSKKCLPVNTTSIGSNCLSANLSSCCKSAIGISLNSPSNCGSFINSAITSSYASSINLYFNRGFPFTVTSPFSFLLISLTTIFLFLNLPPKTVSPTFNGIVISSSTAW